MFGIKYGVKHTWDDWGLYLESFNISEPQAKTKYISVPLRDGDIDLTSSLTGDVKYNNRIITAEFCMDGDKWDFETRETDIVNFLQGQNLHIVPDDDKAYYYVGRSSLEKFDTTSGVARITIKSNVEPYKYDIHSTQDEWEWDPFDFVEGVINSPPDNEIHGEGDVIVFGRRKQTYPTIRASAPMTVTFLGHTYNVPQGLTKMYDIIIREGQNTLHFEGEGTVSIIYRAGEL